MPEYIISKHAYSVAQKSHMCLAHMRISSCVAVPVCGRFGFAPFRSVAVSVCGRFVAISVCCRFGLWPFQFVAVSVCGLSGLWPFRFVAILVVAVSVCGRYDLLLVQIYNIFKNYERINNTTIDYVDVKTLIPDQKRPLKVALLASGD